MKKSLSLIIWVFIIYSSNIFGQITISPTNIFIEENTKFGTYLVLNGSNEPQEVSVEFIFAYTQTDEEGTRSIAYDDTVRQVEHSADSWVRAFPRNFTLAPGQRQVVRLRVSPPNNLEDGTYWARIKTRSTAQTPPVELQSDNAVSARVGITIEQVTGMYFKKGNVTTGIDVLDTSASLTEDGFAEAKVKLLRTGNSPFLGSITMNIKDSNNNIVKSSFRSTTIYFDGTHSQEVDIQGLQAGTYTVDITFESQRSDVSSQDIVKMEPVTTSTELTIR
ncbi:MAG: hypothetical protein ABJR05_03995 [Balneola sp.]